MDSEVCCNAFGVEDGMLVFPLTSADSRGEGLVEKGWDKVAG